MIIMGIRNGHFSEVSGEADIIKNLQIKRMEQQEKDEVADLLENTSETFEASDDVERTYSDEELKEIWDNDPGYVNERAMKSLDDSAVEGYLKTGYHSEGLMNYGKDAVENTEKETLIPEGKILERWGSERGSYMTEPGTDFSKLHMIVSEDKLDKQSYVVLKPFWVTESKVASQPYDDSFKEEGENAVQYHAGICVEDLLELGYLKRKDEDDMQVGNFKGAEDVEKTEDVENMENAENVNDTEEELSQGESFFDKIKSLLDSGERKENKEREGTEESAHENEENKTESTNKFLDVNDDAGETGDDEEMIREKECNRGMEIDDDELER